MNKSRTLEARTLGCVAAILAVLAASQASARPAHREEPVRIPEGTPVNLTLERPLSSEFNQPGDRFQLFVTAPVMLDGHLLIRPGTQVQGHVTLVHRCGRLARRGRLAVEIDEVQINGQTIALMPLHRTADPRESGFHRVVHQVTSPFRDVAGNLTAGLGDTSPEDRFRPPNVDHDTKLAQDIVESDPFDQVEFGGSASGQIAHRGLVGVERVTTNAAAFVLGGGPLGLFHRGSSLDVPAGAVLHTVVARAE